MWPTEILMASPDFFSIEYAINSHMMDSSGNLKKVDQGKAIYQWMILKDTLSDLGMTVHTMETLENFPDMVFCANTFLPFKKNGKKAAIMSHMAHTERQGEVAHTREWLNTKGFLTIEAPHHKMEGMGDFLWNYEAHKIFAGYGFRTEAKAIDEVEKILEQPIHRLKLVNPLFYHLDTCLMILDAQTCFYVKEAFDSQGQRLLKQEFSQCHPIDLEEAKGSFALNGVALANRTVVLPHNSPTTQAKLEELKFKVIPVNTGEFIKAGGSAFCMKNFL